MREQLARWIAVLTATVLVSLALFFALIHNPTPTEPEVHVEVAPPMALSTLAEAGRIAYQAQRCAACHTIDGVGSPRSPLDGVGARRDEQALRAWIVGASEVADQLPDNVLRRKRQYQELATEDLDAMVAYLRTLRP